MISLRILLLERSRWINDRPDGAIFFISLLIDILFLFFLFFLINDQQARIAGDLIELRNKSVYAFFMFNTLFVLIVFLLQLNKDQLHVVWPLGVKENITMKEDGEVPGSVPKKKEKNRDAVSLMPRETNTLRVLRCSWIYYTLFSIFFSYYFFFFYHSFLLEMRYSKLGN